MKCLNSHFKGKNSMILNKKHQMCIVGLMMMSFIKGICIGMYLTENNSKK